MANNSFQTVKYIVTFRRGKADPVEHAQFNTAEAAYNFAIGIESNGGLTLVAPLNSIAPVTRAPKLHFEED